MSVPSDHDVRAIVGEAGMMTGHWFPPHVRSPARYAFSSENGWYRCVALLM